EEHPVALRPILLRYADDAPARVWVRKLESISAGGQGNPRHVHRAAEREIRQLVPFVCMSRGGEPCREQRHAACDQPSAHEFSFVRVTPSRSCRLCARDVERNGETCTNG